MPQDDDALTELDEIAEALAWLASRVTEPGDADALRYLVGRLREVRERLARP